MVTTTVVGNYPKIPNRPRPARLRQAIARFDRGAITEAELHAVEDNVTREVIDEQVEAGIDLVTDGQVRWDDELTYFARALKGVSIDGLVRFFNNNTYYRQPVIEGDVAWREPATVRDCRFAAEHSPRPVKAVLPGPYTLARLSLDSHYGSLEKLTINLAEALNHEIHALAAAGAPVVQINEPSIVEHEAEYPLFARAVERAFDGVTVEKALYIYFGDVAGLLPRLLDLPVDTIGLDFVSGPATWQALGDAPFPRKLGLGIIDARNTKMERPEAIAEAVQRALRLVPPERLYVNPSCGLDFLPREVAQAKLARLVEGVRLGQEARAR